MIGHRVGVKAGSILGARVGIGTDELAPQGGMSGVTRDATSGIYCPANASEWATTMAAAGIGSGGPSALYLLQEASGNPADSIGSFTLTAAGTGGTYQNAVSGWSRKAINTTDNSNQSFSSTAAGLPDLSAGSMLLLAYLQVTSAAATRNLLRIGSGASASLFGNFTTLNHCQVLTGASTTSTSAVDDHNRVLPYAIKHNFTSSAQAGYTDQSKLVPTFAAASGKTLRLGSAGLTTPACSMLYAVAFFNAAAELTDAQVKTLLTTLGWSPTWT